MYLPNFSAGVLDSYGSGGFVARLGYTRTSAESVLNDLFNNSWITQNSAVMIHECAFYNVNVNLLSLVAVVFEFAPFGSVLVTTNIRSMKLYRSTQGLHIFILILECAYVLYTLYFLVYECRRFLLIKMEYLKNMWNLLELGNVLVSLALIAVYIAHTVEVNKAIEIYRQDKIIDFDKVAMLDDIMSYLFGLLVSYGMIQFLHLLRFNPMIHHFSAVIGKAQAAITLLAVIFTVCFIGFSSMMSLFTGWRVAMFKSIPTGIKSLFLVILGDPQSDAITEFHMFWGPALMLTFIIFSLYILLNFLIVIMISALAEVKANPQPAQDAELLWLLFDKFRQWLGVKGMPFLPGEVTWQSDSDDSIDTYV